MKTKLWAGWPLLIATAVLTWLIPAMGQTLPGHDDDAYFATAEAGVKTKLKDPESAQFRNLVVHDVKNGSALICGQVNAKNAFGGYVGFRNFFALGDVAQISSGEGDTSFDVLFLHFCGNASDKALAKRIIDEGNLSPQ